MAVQRQEMAKAYDPRAVEGRVYQFWEKGGYFAPRIDPNKEPFVIIMPPPNVTGELHMGHALTATIEDILTRWHRMLGEPTLWLPGVDHAGIATQVVVERDLAKEGLTRHHLGREEFLERVWQWVRRHRHIITEQHKRLGASCDWQRERFTMDEGPARAVRTTFVNLYHDGLIYRGERIINWCPRCMTALSDLEVDHQEVQGHLWYVRYPVVEGDENRPTGEYVTIATTRPETIMADVAVAVNPYDQRYLNTLGEHVLVPLVQRKVPLVPDEAVDPSFGTGALKITPGHDPVDFEVGERHNLPIIMCINLDGTMNAEAGPYEGMDRFECRDAVVRDLDEAGLLAKVEPYAHAVGHCQRCRTMVEPLVSKQWFVKMEPLAKPAIEAVRQGRINIIPQRFAKTYFDWMENIRDWCISRQLWWGHRIPAWYCEECGEQAVPGPESPMQDPAACPQCGSSRLRQDPDVLDTWFSSALWPHSTLGWPEETPDLHYFYPTTVMETGYDILFFWVARMIMMGLYNTGDIPFHTVYLHGLIRDEQGQKMSKTRGNVVDPLELVDAYGADALRFALASSSTPGSDMRITESKLEGGRNFANKLWNASRFVIQSLEGQRVSLLGGIPTADMPLEDRWILSRASRVCREVHRYVKRFEIDEAGRLIHDFFWSEFCDWYIEMAKVRLRDGDQSPLPVLAEVLHICLRLLHPYMPFITEEIWQQLRQHIDSPLAKALIVADYPHGVGALDPKAEESLDAVIEVVRAIRNMRAERGVGPARWVEAYVATDHMLPVMRKQSRAISTLARVQPLHLVKNIAETPRQQAVTAVLRQAQVVLPLAGLFDIEAERARLRQQIQQMESQVERLSAKLNTPGFRQKAPAAVMAREEERLAEARSRLEALRARLAELD